MNWTLFFIIIAAVIAVIGWFDMLTYMVKRTPKVSMLPRYMWWLTFVATVFLAYEYFSTHSINL